MYIISCVCFNLSFKIFKFLPFKLYLSLKYSYLLEDSKYMFCFLMTFCFNKCIAYTRYLFYINNIYINKIILMHKLY